MSADAQIPSAPESQIAPPPLAPDELRWRCDPDRFSFETTAELEPVPGIPGQESALEALRFGLEFQGAGQNIVVMVPAKATRTAATRNKVGGSANKPAMARKR